MSDPTPIRITNDGSPHGTKITVGGRNVENVTAVRVEQKANDAWPTVTLDILAVQGVVIDTPVLIEARGISPRDIYDAVQGEATRRARLAHGAGQ